MQVGTFQEINISDIKIGKRLRKDIGDIKSLAKSIEEIGLLHPIVCTEKLELVAGHRRIKAFEYLKRQTISTHIISIDQIVKGEFHENGVRKQFTPSEMVAIKRILEPEVKAEAKKRQAAPSMDPYGNIGMSELGLPDIFPGGIPDAKAVEALQRIGAKLDAQLESGEITKESYEKKVTAITKPKVASERVKIAEKEIAGTSAGDALQEFYREQQPPAQLPQSMTGMLGEQAEGAGVGMPGSDMRGGPTESFPSPEEGLLGDEEQAPAQMPNFLQQAGQQGGPERLLEEEAPMVGQPSPEFQFSQLPVREEIGKVPRSFTRRRIPKRGTVREE